MLFTITKVSKSSTNKKVIVPKINDTAATPANEKASSNDVYSVNNVVKFIKLS